MHLISIFFTLLFVSFVCHFASSANEENKVNLNDIMTNIMKIKEKVEKLELSLPTRHNMDEMKMDINKKIEEQDKKSNEMEKYLNKIEDHFKKLDIIEEKFKTFEDNFKTIEDLLHEMIEKSDQKMNASESKMDITSELTAQCSSMCESKVMIWANETSKQFKDNLDQQEVCIKEDNSTTKIYLKQSNLCDPNPCLNGGRCDLTSTGSEYLCSHCPYPTSGKRCENVMCGGNKCYQLKDTVYVLFELSGTWEQANRKCVSEGMTLAMPKDKDSTEFLANHLRLIFGYSVAKKYIYFWFGLSYNGSAKQWQWADGSPLGEYTGGHSSLKSYTDQRCSMLHLESRDRLWSPERCDTLSSSYPVYALCEKRISVS